METTTAARWMYLHGQIFQCWEIVSRSRVDAAVWYMMGKSVAKLARESERRG